MSHISNLAIIIRGIAGFSHARKLVSVAVVSYHARITWLLHPTIKSKTKFVTVCTCILWRRGLRSQRKASELKIGFLTRVKNKQKVWFLTFVTLTTNAFKDQKVKHPRKITSDTRWPMNGLSSSRRMFTRRSSCFEISKIFSNKPKKSRNRNKSQKLRLRSFSRRRVRSRKLSFMLTNSSSR